MFCTKCGKSIANGSLFCEYCGSPIGQVGQPAPPPQQMQYNNPQANQQMQPQMQQMQQNVQPAAQRGANYSQPPKKGGKGPLVAVLSICGAVIIISLGVLFFFIMKNCRI